MRIVSVPETFKNNMLKPNAIVRILIPLERPEPEDPQNPEAKGDKSHRSELSGKEEASKSAESAEAKEEEKKGPVEIEYEDKVLAVKPVTEGLYVLALHQAAAREFRNQACEFIRAHFEKDLDGVELEDIQKKAEEIAVTMDERFVSLFPGVPVFSYEKN